MFGRRKEKVVFPEETLIGTLVRIDEEGNEPGYVDLWYIPSETFSAKPHKYPKPIKKEHIYHFKAVNTNIPGVKDDWTMVFTGNPNSPIARVIGVQQQQRINDLLEENKQLRMQLAAKKQSNKDLASGAESSIASARAITNAGRSSDLEQNPFLRNDDVDF